MVFSNWTDKLIKPSIEGRTIYVIDDDAGIRKSTGLYFRSIGLKHWPYANGADFLEHIDQCEPGCVLLDLRMPFISGLDVLAKLADWKMCFPTIVMTGHGDVETAVKAMKLGAIDFLEKPFEEPVVLMAVENAFKMIERSSSTNHPGVDVLRTVEALTPRQIEVLAGLVEGLSNKAIAIQMNIAPRTVEMHRANLMSKLKVHSLAEVVKFALPLGLPPLTKSRSTH